MESPESSSGRLTRFELLALDVATTTGYYSLHGSGAWRFHATRHRRTYLEFYRTLREFILRHGIRRIVAEDVSFNAHNRDLRKLSELRGIVLLVSEELNLLPVEFVNASSLKKFATGDGHADKVRMMAACIDDYRFHPSSHDEADAFLLFHYYVHKHRIR